MHLRRDDEQLQLVLSETELTILRNGLNEALEALEDWEFSTRMGVERAEAKRVRDELREALRGIEEPRSGG